MPRRLGSPGIALLLRKTDEMEEEGRHRRDEMRDLPVHPPLDVTARERIGRVEPTAAARRREIAQNCVRFPNDGVPVLDREGLDQLLEGTLPNELAED